MRYQVRTTVSVRVSSSGGKPFPQFQGPRLFGVVSVRLAPTTSRLDLRLLRRRCRGSAVPVGTHSPPTWNLQVDPTGQFLYATYDEASGIYLQAFSISQFSGTQQPTPIASPIFLSDAEQPVLAPYVFVASGTDDLCDYRNWPAGGGTEYVYFAIAPSLLFMYVWRSLVLFRDLYL